MPNEDATTLYFPEDPNNGGRTLVVDPSSTSMPAELQLPTSIGRYRIIRLLGEGGMGAVYEAEQGQPRRHVALKVIKAAWASPELLRRFVQESHVLGRLHHPGIAQIYEAGSADTGFGRQPFFAMELIHGKPLVEYAEEHKLSTRQRLELMIQVCDAVQHAHQRGIIHRDLKPGNILVDETGRPKILDFGLARITDSEAQTTRQTDLGQVLGTLPFMSPEQVTGDPEAIDTRSDVYALGVILYLLLAGKLPYTLTGHLHEAVRTIQEVDPPPLSSVSRIYRGDIETIVAKALEKDKTRRYASANGLSADIRRYLDDQPISAKPASPSYQLRKFARRHKALVAGAGAVFVVLCVGIVASTREAVRARRAEASAQAINNFLENDLLAQASASSQSGPATKPVPNLTVRTALDRAAARVDGKFDKQPEVEAGIRDTMGVTYFDLGEYPEARKQLERAAELYRSSLGAENPKTLQAVSSLGKVAERQGKYSEAESLLSHTVDIERRVLGPEHPETLTSMDYLATGYWYQGKYAQAETIYSQVLEIRRRVLGPEHRKTLQSMHNLGMVYNVQGKYAQAEVLYSHVLEISRRVLGPEHPDTLKAMDNLALVYANQGKYARSEALSQQALEIERRVLGPEHADTLLSMRNLARVYWFEGKYAQSEALNKRALEIEHRLLGPEHPQTLNSMNDVAWELVADPDARERRPKEALQLIRSVVKTAPNYKYGYATLGLAEYRNNHWDEAIAALNRSVEMDKEAQSLDFFFFAMAHWQRGEKDEAVHFFQQGVAGATEDPTNQEQRTFWAEAAKLLGKPGPPPVH